MLKQHLRKSFGVLILSSLFLGSAFAQSGGADKNVIKLGVTSGPHDAIAKVVKEVAKKEGLDIRTVVFDDFMRPNAALNDGDIDANSFQHDPFLERQVKDKNYQLVKVADTFNFPMGVYSLKIKSIGELKNNATIGIPNDPTNGGRALLLLQDSQLIKLRPGSGLGATPKDIIDNPKKLKFIPMDAAIIPKNLRDVDAAAINTDYAVQANLNPEKDSILREKPNSPYANILAVRKQDQNQPWVAKLVRAYKSQEVKDYVKKAYKGSLVVVD